MGSHKKPLILCAIVILASAFSAQAADYRTEPPVVELPPEKSFGGWYLRGDIGYSITELNSVSYFQGATQTGSFNIHEIDDTFMFGVGIGYQVNDWFRVDWTANYYGEADMTGSSALNVACSDGTVGAICSYRDNSSFQATTFLANAYVDIGNYSGFTPYVGFGVGGAYVNWGNINNQEYSVSGATPAVLASDLHAGANGWRFAYALHAGASYDINTNLKIDAGYSYVNIAEGGMFGFGVASGLVGTQGYHSDLDIHTFKLGLRYMIGETVETSARY